MILKVLLKTVRRHDPYKVLNDEIKSVGKRTKPVIERIPWLELMQVILECSPSIECMYLNCCFVSENFESQQNMDD